jgi:PAS domain S-box-containing protein
MNNESEASAATAASSLKVISSGDLPSVAKKARKTGGLPKLGGDPHFSKVIRQFSGIGEFAGDAFVCQSLDGKIAYWNAAATNMLGYTSAEVLGQDFKMLLTPESSRQEEGILELIGGDGQIQKEIVCVRKDGKLLDVSMAVAPLRSSTGAIVGASKILRDISDLKQSRQTLQLFQSCFSTINDIILVMDATLGDANGPQIVYANEALERVIGYSPAELLGRGPEYIKSEQNDSSVLVEIQEAMRLGKPMRRQVVNRRKDGQEVHMELDLAPIVDTAGRCTHFVAVYHDVSELRRFSDQVDDHTAFLDRAQDAIVMQDLNGRILSWNKAAERIYGWTRDEILSRNIADQIYVDPRKFAEINATTLEKGEWCGDQRHRSKDQRELTVETRRFLLREKDGRPKSVLGVKTDVTEKRKIEVQFIRAQRMASLGLLAGGIAHDLNNILTPIMLSIDMLKGMVQDPNAKPVLETIELSARRGSDIVQQVLSFARGMEGQRIVIQPKYMIREIEHIVRDTFPKDIRLQFSLPYDTWTIIGDPTQVQQVLLNLCVNARDAMPNGGTLVIDAKNCLVDEHYVAMNPQAKPGMYVAISVTDGGIGIPDDIIDKIFEPFFTTKDVGKGTGLGLSSVQAIVKSHGGFINVISEPNHGTTFKIYLPAQEAVGDSFASETQEASLPKGSGETILVVDDENSIISITRQTLEAFGYNMITARNGAEAVAIYAQKMDKIAVILTDLSMPVMDGRAAIYALLNINPKAKIIAMSGMDESKSVIMASNAGIKHFISKPYTAATLLKTLKSVVES